MSTLEAVLRYFRSIETKSHLQSPTIMTKGPDSDNAATMASCNEFALDLYDKLRRQERGNLFSSPFSVSTALAMIYAGADGETAKEIATVLRLSPGSPQLYASFAALLQELDTNEETPRDFELSLANALWYHDSFSLLENYQDLLRTNFGANLEKLDFGRDVENAVKKINRWVEKQTRGKIHSIAQRNSLNPLTKIILTNAIYFKGTWVLPFTKDKTKDVGFAVTTRQKVKVPMMKQRGGFEYLEKRSFQALKLAYRGNRHSMVIFLPRRTGGLEEFEELLSFQNLQSWLAELQYRDVILQMPRFRAEGEIGLAKVLSEMGMGLAFDEVKANFSRMSMREPLYLSSILHKAFADVNEEGTEAAAVTYMGMPLASRWQLPKRPILFRADHPFFLLIMDNSSGIILFLGRIIDPQL